MARGEQRHPHVRPGPPLLVLAADRRPPLGRRLEGGDGVLGRTEHMGDDVDVGALGFLVLGEAQAFELGEHVLGLFAPSGVRQVGRQPQQHRRGTFAVGHGVLQQGEPLGEAVAVEEADARLAQAGGRLPLQAGSVGGSDAAAPPLALMTATNSRRYSGLPVPRSTSDVATASGSAPAGSRAVTSASLSVALGGAKRTVVDPGKRASQPSGRPARASMTGTSTTRAMRAPRSSRVASPERWMSSKTLRTGP